MIVQLLNCIWLFATPWTAAHQAFLSFTISWSLLKLRSTESVMSPNHIIPGGSVVKNLTAIQETWVPSLGWEDSLENGELSNHPLQQSCLENSWQAIRLWCCKELDRTEPLTCSLSTNKLPGALHLFLLSLLSMFVLVRLPYDPKIAPSSWRCHEWQQKGDISFLCLLLWSRKNDLKASLWSSPHMPMLEPACMIHVLKDRAAGQRENTIRVLSLWWLVLCVNLAKLESPVIYFSSVLLWRYFVDMANIYNQLP